MKTFLTILLSAAFITSSYSQFDILDKVKEETEKKVEEETDKAIEKELDGEKKSEEESTQTESNESEDNVEESGSLNTETTNAKEELKSYSKFDFIPGDKIIFYDDFSMDAVGDFPQKWNTNGSGEVVALNNYPGSWFKLQDAVSYLPYMDVNTFGENFTIEIDFLLDVPENSNYGTIYIDFYSSDNFEDVPSSSSGPNKPGLQFEMFPGYKNQAGKFVAVGFKDEGGYVSSGNPNSTDSKGFKEGEINRLSFAFNKQRFRAYINEKKTLDLPRVLQADVNINHINLRTWYWNTNEDYSILIKDIRIAQGQTDTRNQLLTEGKLVTHGILFDSGSDKIKPESYGTLKSIAEVLKENSSVKVKIIGHTDNDGDDNSNLDLSKKRALSVKNALNSEFGIDASRLETDGKGETEPAADNNSTEGKASNRRVEFLKL